MPITRSIQEIERDGNARYDYTWKEQMVITCLLYTSDAADDSLRVDLGGRRIIKKYMVVVV